MQEHLTDEQLTEQLAGGAGTAAREHLAACPDCREEEQRLEGLLTDYGQAIHTAARRPEAFWQWQRTAIATRRARRPGSRRLAWVAAAAAVVLAAILLTAYTPPTKPVAESDPDQALLADVQRSVRRELPRALEPAALLAQEISRGAEARSSP
jgi:hypothetical protein